MVLETRLFESWAVDVKTNHCFGANWATVNESSAHGDANVNVHICLCPILTEEQVSDFDEKSLLSSLKQNKNKKIRIILFIIIHLKGSVTGAAARGL